MNISMNDIGMSATDLTATKQCYSSAFGQTFEDYGDTYCAILNTGINDGFNLTNSCSNELTV